MVISDISRFADVVIHTYKNFLLRLKTAHPPRVAINYQQALAKRNHAIYRTLADAPLSLRLTEATRLDPLDAEHGTYSLRFTGEGGTSVQAGDLLYVKWRNRDVDVDVVLRLFGLTGSEWILIDTYSAAFQPGKLRIMQIRDAFKHEVDLRQAGRRILKHLGYDDALKHNDEQEELHTRRYLTAGHESGITAPRPRYLEYRLIDMLMRHSEELDLATFLRLQDRISARAYSLSRIENNNSGFTAEITVSQLERNYLCPDGKPRLEEGRSAGYLTSLTPGELVSGWLIPDVHRFPQLAGEERPLILICAGSGIAGAMSLLRSDVQLSETWLLYGVRNMQRKCLYGDEIDDFARSARLSRIDYAESRPDTDPAARRGKRVTDILWEQRGEIASWLRRNAAVTIIGKLEMGLDVTTVLLKILVDQGLAPDVDSAKTTMAEWKRNLRVQAAVSGL